MILLTAIVAGILVGMIGAWRAGVSWQLPILRHIWLAIVGFLPQLLAFYLPATRNLLNKSQAAVCLVLSQLLLLGFCLGNLKSSGIAILAGGLTLNLLVILANGGLMPLPVETANKLLPQSVMDTLKIGQRLSTQSKDILLPAKQIVLPWLADRFTSPPGFPYLFVFSLGDVLIAAGAFWLLAKPLHKPDPSN